MRQVQVGLFEFDELDEDVQEKVINNQRETKYDDPFVVDRVSEVICMALRERELKK